jgi:hypothetical protein
MADCEKVIKGLECCKTENCSECPYEDTSAPVGKFGTDELVACQPVLYADAISLLEVQEPVEPIEMIDDFYPIGDPLRTIGWRCGKCGGRIGGYENYCPECGRAVKWE